MDDPFWTVAMSSGEGRQSHGFEESNNFCGDDDENNDNNDDNNQVQVFPIMRTAKSVLIQQHVDDDDNDDTFDNTMFELKLSPLANCVDPLGAPVGAHIWHASAILSQLELDTDYLLERMARDRHHQSLTDEILDRNMMTVLELGSGAMGLAGLTWAAKHHHLLQIIVSDTCTEHGVLQQLERNVERNASLWRGSNSGIYNDISSVVRVVDLDWRDYQLSSSLSSSSSTEERPDMCETNLNHADSSSGSQHSIDPTKIDWIIGSELVYTTETSRALGALILYFLQVNPSIQILICQVTDRPGFQELLLESLLPHDDILIIWELQPLPMEWHDRATQLMKKKAWGTMSRDDYGMIWIQSVSSAESKVGDDHEARQPWPSLLKYDTSLKWQRLER